MKSRSCHLSKRNYENKINGPSEWQKFVVISLHYLEKSKQLYICSYICVYVCLFVSNSLTKRKMKETRKLVHSLPLTLSKNFFFDQITVTAASLEKLPWFSAYLLDCLVIILIESRYNQKSVFHKKKFFSKNSYPQKTQKPWKCYIWNCEDTARFLFPVFRFKPCMSITLSHGRLRFLKKYFIFYLPVLSFILGLFKTCRRSWFSNPCATGNTY